MTETAQQPLTEQSRVRAGMATRIYILMLGENDEPAQVPLGRDSVITTYRTDPDMPVYTAAAEAVRERTGHLTPEPELIGVLRTDDTYAVVLCVRLPATRT